MLILASQPARPALVNRWTFSSFGTGNAPAGTTFSDSISGTPLVVQGNGATLTGTTVVLPGGTNGNQTAAAISAYLNLPNGILSSKTNFTIETWATPLSADNWMRVFDFGRVNTAGSGGGAVGEIIDSGSAPGTTSSYDNILLSFCINSNLSAQRLESLLNGANTVTEDTALATTAGTQYHYVLTFQDGVGAYGSGGGQITWYRNGVVAATEAVPWHLAQMSDVNNWLGRSMWTSDNMTHGSYREVRIYDHAMSSDEVAASDTAGPDNPNYTVSTSPLAPAQPADRWSFNGAAGSVSAGTGVTDTIGGQTAIIKGNGATYTGSSVILPGTTTGNQSASTISAYIDLPNGIIHTKPNLTVEMWATPISSLSYQRLFDFGRTTATVNSTNTGEIIDGASAPGTYNGSDGISLSLDVGTSLGDSRMEGLKATAATYVDTDLSAATSAGTEYHYIVTVQNQSGTSALMKWYRNGVLQNIVTIPFSIASLSDFNNWIGRSQYSADSLSNMAVHEVRLYNKVLSDDEIALSDKIGPDTTFGTVVTQPDTVTINPGQKVLIPVLANDTGSINPSTVQIVSAPTTGTATVDASGSKILYAHPGGSTAPVTFTYRVYGFGGYSSPQTVTVNISSTLRFTNTGSTVNVPSSPPSTAYQLVNAFPGLTFSEPVCLASVAGDTKRLFVCELPGKLKVIPDVTATTATSAVVLDLAALLATRSNPGETISLGGDGEAGLLGVAFHPNFASNGYFYVAYAVQKSTDTSVWYERLSRFTVPQSQINSSTPVADPTTEQILIEQRDREDNHNGGGLHFGPDGYLYWCVGDEGNGYDHFGNSQNIYRNFFSALLRIDVDKKAGNLEPNAHPNPNESELNPSGYATYVSLNAIPRDNGIARYSIPVDNPFVSGTQGGPWDGTFNGAAVSATDLPYVRSEFYAVGLRSPWGFSFDSATGDLWLGDVGQDTYEEVDIIKKGGNYGWVYREGKHDTNFTTPVPPTKPAGFTSIDPVWDYAHTGVTDPNYPDADYRGNCVIGGVVYHGANIPSLAGSYIFCDFNYNQPTNMWSLTRSGTNVTVQRLGGVTGVVFTGTDPSNGDVLMSNFNTGNIQRLTSANVGSYPSTLSATGLFADLSDLSPSPGLVSYAPNLAFWSDFAKKSRWFMMPDSTSTITWAHDAPWTFPTGMIWVKHFDMPLVRSNPPLATDPLTPSKRIETRVLVKTASGVYGVSYKWNDAGTDATLVPESGQDFPITVTENGTVVSQTYHIPSRSECLACHNATAGMSLSFNTRQLNCTGTMSGIIGNEISMLHSGGFFSNTPDPVNTLPRFLRPDETTYPVEARVRSYLAVNCSQCHQGAGSPAAPAIWNALPQLQLANMGLVNVYGINYPNAKLIDPGSVNTSLVYNRVAAANGYSRMPPIGTRELDETDMALLTQWISNYSSTHQTYDQWHQVMFGTATPAGGDQNVDSDGDGVSNYAEFLMGTDPLNAGSRPVSQLAVGATGASFSFTAPANRSAFIDVSTDLVNWTVWDAPGNNGLPLSGQPVTISGPSLGPAQFFRLRLQEN